MIDKQKIFRIIILLGLISLLAIIFIQKIDFTRIDLGRHLENGKIVFENPKVLVQNFYSYTEPEFKFINHHWLSGVVFYLVYSLGGFKLLTVFNTILAIILFLLVFNFARKKSNFYLSVAVSIPVIFLLSERVEIRPEIFSYFFIFLTWFLIDKTAKDQKWKRLYWFIPLFILWVNSHIYFLFGLAMIGLKFATEFILAFIKNKDDLKNRLQLSFVSARPWIKYFLISFLACLINPNFWRGLLYPFNIFHNYGYEIAENKSIFYLEKLFINPNFLLFKIVLVFLIISWVIYFLFSKKLRLFELFVTILFFGLALFASRNLALFGIVALMIMPVNLLNFFKYLRNVLFSKWPIIENTAEKYFFSLFLLIIIISGIYLINSKEILKNQSGLGLSSDGFSSVTFFKENNLSGPIFNNYDLGSALIFWLFPDEKVFVDNRPEAYSNKFFTETYIPMQNDYKKWQEANKLYQFKTIYFSYTDNTPWAQAFLKQILNNSDWSLVYFDRSAVILLNKKLNNATLINKLNIDDESFKNQLRDLADNSTLKERRSLASLAENKNQLLLAEEIYKGILLDSSDYIPALISLGYIYSANQPTQALNYLEKTLKGGYKIPGVYNQIGLINWQLGEYKKAESSWHSALKLDRKNSSALYYLDQIKQLRDSGKLIND